MGGGESWPELLRGKKWSKQWFFCYYSEKGEVDVKGRSALKSVTLLLTDRLESRDLLEEF